MNRKIAIPLVVLLIAALFGGGYYVGSHRHDEHAAAGQQDEKTQWTCGMHPFIIRDEPGLCPICNMELTPLKPGTGGQPTASAEQKVKHWVSPMDATYVREAPGKDYMGHDLVPVYETGGSGAISIDPVTAQNMGVRLAVAERRDLARSLRTVGLVVVPETRQSSINTKIEGWLERLYIDQTGQQVSKGAPVAEIYSPDLVAAQQEYLLAVRNHERLAGSDLPGVADGAGRMLEAARTRLNYWGISDRQLAELQRSGTPQRTMTLYSPFSGVVTMKKAVQGMRVMAGEEIAQLADLSTIWVNADIYQADLAWLKVGQRAAVELPFGGQTLDGKVTFIQPMLGSDSRTVKARIELANPGLLLKPDMFANVVIRTDEVRQSLAVPSEAILDAGSGQTVFVALGDGKFEPRSVRTGVRDDSGYVQILAGLTDGEQVVVSAQFMLDSESKLREALRKMSEPQAPAAAPAEPKKEKLDDLFK